MHILYVNHTQKPSGAGLSLSTLLRYLPSELRRYFWLVPHCEIDSMLGATAENTYYDRYLCQFMTTMYGGGYSIPLYIWHSIKGLAAFPRLRHQIRKQNIDLVHINETTLIVYAFAAAWSGKPVVLHARTALKKNRFENLLIKQLASLKKLRIIAIDEEVKKSFPAECHSFIQIVYNPIEIGPSPDSSQTQKLRELWGFSPEHIVVGQVASLHPQKGIWTILEIAEKLCVEFQNMRFVLVGDTSAQAGEGQKLKTAIIEKGLEKKIVLAGYYTDLPLVYSAMDIALCLFGSGLGGVGRTAYEAALCGKALVATIPDPDQSQTLENRKASLLYSCEDRAGVEAGIRKLAQDTSYRIELGKNAKELIGMRHDPGKIAGEVLKIYRDLLS